MSRTIRRNKKHLILDHVGTLDEAKLDSWWVLYRYPGLTVEQAHNRRLARFMGDNKSGYHSVPGWYVRTFFTRPERRAARVELHHHNRRDEWDDHLPAVQSRGAGWSWF